MVVAKHDTGAPACRSGEHVEGPEATEAGLTTAIKGEKAFL
jgi:hypothetical protein